MPSLERPSAISSRTCELARGEAVERVGAVADEELGDDLGVEGGAAGGDPAQRVEEVGDVGDPVLEQVADGAGSL